MKTILILSLAASLAFLACSKDSTSPTSTASNDTLPAIFKKFSSAVDIYIDGNYIVLKTKDIPNHYSCYFYTTDSLYQAYNGPNHNFFQAPAHIEQQNMVFRIPLNPTEASNHSPTMLGPIGISINGVVFFNQYAGSGQPLGSQEINTFDQKNGHPQQTGVYHYHVEPTYLTQTKGSDALLGFLLDGFHVYGPVENGHTITDSVLDSYHGHFGPTADYPNGIYHYHITAEAPYLNGSGYWGTPGTVTQ